MKQSALQLLLAALISGIVSTCGFAQTFLIKNATVHTVSGSVLLAGDVLVKDGKIVAVDKGLSAGGAEVVDLTGLHLYPGLIDATSSLGLTEIEAIRATQDTTEVGSFTPDVRAWLAVNPDSELLGVARANGITHFLALPMGNVLSGQSGLMAMTGWTTEEMTVKKPVALHLFWPKMTIDTTPKDMARDKAKWKSPEDQAKERRRKIQAIDDFFEEAKAYAKARNTAAKGGAADSLINPPWEAMLPFVRREIPLMIHADDYRQIKSAVNWADTNHYHIIIAGARDAWKAAGLLAAKKVPVIYESTYDLPPRDSESYDIQFSAAEILHQAGVKVVFSAGPNPWGATGARNLPYAASQAVAFGLPADEALKGITLYPAEVLGVASRLGSLEPGKEASFFASDGDILDIRSHVKRLWIAGKEVSLESRHTRLYDKYRNRPRPQ